MVYFLLVGVIYVKNNLIRNTLLLLLIPLIVTIVIVTTHHHQYGFSSTVTKNGTTYTEKYKTTRNATRELDMAEEFNENYTFMMFTAIIMIILFIIFYIFLTRKKEW